MELFSVLRTLGALAVVLGLLAGALWLVRRYDLTLPGGMLGKFSGTAPVRRLALIERLPLDSRRSLVLVRRDDREHLVMIAPEGLLLLEALPLRVEQARGDA
ncbi:flagellar biosynthetic protein FliO [Sphingomonas qilianensis]|uniref:Flagellar biosynthetic protein FliO n=1 Tax=Sphingomonas qilianensis TaxID=1736690 RepID=A0ABU9XTU4_9SPHN